MKISIPFLQKLLLPVVFYCLSAGVATAQNADSRETLEWVVRQSGRIDTMLSSVVRSQEPVDLLMKLWRTWEHFDAIAVMGLYCDDVRRAAELGRLESDPLSFRETTDLNALMLRATKARDQARRMRLGAEACLLVSGQAPTVNNSFLPRDILKADAEIIIMDLNDALAARDLYIVTQKVEHAMRILRDAALLSQTLERCDGVTAAIQEVSEISVLVLFSGDWEESEGHLHRALDAAERIKKTEDCR